MPLDLKTPLPIQEVNDPGSVKLPLAMIITWFLAREVARSHGSLETRCKITWELVGR